MASIMVSALPLLALTLLALVLLPPSAGFSANTNTNSNQSVQKSLALLKPLAPVLAWLAIASAPIYGRGEFQGKAAGLGSMTDFSQLENRAGASVEANEYIVAPRGAAPRARVVQAPTFALPADALYASIERAISRQPNIEFIAADAPTLRLEYVQRTPIFRFPDIITLQAIPQGPAASSIAVHSYSIYGAGDLGVNKQRVGRFLAAIADEARSSAAVEVSKGKAQ